MEKNKYKIIHCALYDEYGNIREEHFEVARLKKFLWIFPYWSKYGKDGMDEAMFDYFEPTKFETMEDAKMFINKLNKNVKPNDWKNVVVATT